MPEYLAPGVYVEEIDTGSKPIEGVSTSTAGMIGVTERGPVDVPILLTSLGDYTRWFGERLSLLDFPGHCYTPLAVEGFFNNGGKRLYLTRILDSEGASAAAGELFDRGSAGGADTLVLRAAGELSGTLAPGPLAYALDISALNAGDWIRIGDGSRSEYRQVANVGAVNANTHVPLSFPLSTSHAVGMSVEEFAVAADPAYTAPFTLAQASAAGDTALEITGAAADIATLAGSASVPLEIGGTAAGEHRYSGVVTVHTTTTARVQLRGSVLAIPHASGATATALSLAGAPLQASTLTPAAAAGDRLVYVDNRGGNLDNHGNLVVIDRTNADPSLREVRRIGLLATLTLTTGAYQEYAAGALVEAVTLGDDDRLLAAPAAVAAINFTILNNAIQQLDAGVQLRVGAGATQETVTVQSVTAPNTVNLTAGLVNAHAAGESVVPAFSVKTLSAAAAPGAVVISFTNRVSLSVGDVLRIGDTPDDEYVAIAGIPNRAAAGPDPGNVVLSSPLVRAHPIVANVRRQNGAAPTAVQATPLVLTAPAGSSSLLVSDGTGFALNALVRVTASSGDAYFHRLASNSTTAANVAEVELDHPLGLAHPEGSALVERRPLLDVRALDAGSWGNRLRISVEDEFPGSVPRTRLATVVDPLHIRLDSASGVEAGTIFELLNPLADDAVVGDLLKVESIDRQANSTITLRAPGLSATQQAAQTAALIAGTRLGVRSREFRITVNLLHQADPARPSRNELIIDSEMYRYLSLDPRHSRYAPRVIGDINGAPRLVDHRPEGESNYIRIQDPSPSEDVRLGPETLVDILPSGRWRAARHPLTSVRGDDSLATLTDAVYEGLDNIDPDLRTGLFSLTTVDDISIVAAPGRISAGLQGALISHCENLRYRFAVLDGPAPPADSIPDVQNQRQQYDTKYAALYYPWVLIDDPYPANLQDIHSVPIPPSGHVVGVYARTDIERGVHKAPANEVVRGITGLQRIINKGEQEILNPFPSNINVIRDFRPNNRGIRIWGGRVITSDPDWKYVNVRRLLIFIEKSIDIGLQWVVFEPNADPLWARVRRTISNFLTTVWRSGALEGTKPEEAYFVRCDRTTMTQADIDNGRLIVVIGVAPVKPAEFVIIRIGLFTAHAEE
jgi:phage tail sheath protein FI